MTFSEAIEAVGRMLDGFPHGRPPNQQGYIGALAATLGQYPRSVASRCADVRSGVAREVKFLPTVADLVAWCERETEAMRRPIDAVDRFERLAQDQARARREDEALQATRVARPMYDDLKAKYGPNWGLSTIDEVLGETRKHAGEILDRANALALADEFAASGQQPTGDIPVSPSLRKLIAEQNAERARSGASVDRMNPADLDGF